MIIGGTFQGKNASYGPGNTVTGAQCTKFCKGSEYSLKLFDVFRCNTVELIFWTGSSVNLVFLAHTERLRLGYVRLR